MRAVIQRVQRAKVTVEGEPTGEIAAGWLVLLGVGPADTARQVVWLAEKVANLRAFDDPGGKMNLSVQDVGGAVLVVSQFTLYGDTARGRRPSYVAAARGEHAEPLVDTVVAHLRALGATVATGRFGADMAVELVNDGPVTLLLEL